MRTGWDGVEYKDDGENEVKRGGGAGRSREEIEARANPTMSVPNRSYGSSEELRELFRPAIAKRIEPLMEQLQEQLMEDEEFFREVYERYEKGVARGHYPELQYMLSEAADEGREHFLRNTGTRMGLGAFMPPKEQVWDESPYDGNMASYREDLYGGMAFAFQGKLREFAQEWLEELARVGFRGVGGVWHETDKMVRVVEKQAESDSGVPSIQGYRKAYVGVVYYEDSLQTLWLQLDGKRSLEHGFREVSVSDDPLRSDKAVLAALTALEGRKIDRERLRKALPNVEISPDTAMFFEWMKGWEDDPHRGEGYESLKNEGAASLNGLKNHRTLDYVLLLLRHYRDDFDRLPPEDKAALVEHTCSHINEFLESLRKLTAFLEYGEPGKKTSPKTKAANQDVKAAVLKDVAGLTHRGIVAELGLNLSADYKGDYPKVRQMVKRGRYFLEYALSKEGWQEHIEDMKTEAERWASLSENEQDAEAMSEALGIPYEKALKESIQESEYVARMRDSANHGQPEND